MFINSIILFFTVIGHCNIDSTSVAREVLQFYCKGLNASWKFPVGYFLSAGVDSGRKTFVENRI